MKVGIVVPFSWSFWGGVVDHADNQVRYLRELGVDARIVMGHDPPGRLTRALHPRPGRHDVPPDYVLPVGRSVIVPANSSLSNIVLSPPAMLRMRRIFERERFDLVHVHEPLAPILSAFAIASSPVPVVVTCHASGGRWFRAGTALWGRLLEDSIAHRIAVSEQAAATAAKYTGRAYEVIPNGVRLPERPADPAKREHRIVFVGRHEPRKGLQVLLRAWPDIHRRTGARLRVIGADPLAVRFLLRRLGLEDAGIDVLGVVPNAQLTAELASAKALVAPSVGGESFGLVLTEAFAQATPVVASEIPGYVEVVDRDTGVLVPPGQPAVLADAVSRLLDDETRRRQLALAGRARAEDRYDWRGVAARLAGIYELVTGLRTPVPAGASASSRREL